MTIYTKSVTSGVSKLFSFDDDSDVEILNNFGKYGPTLRNSINLLNKSKRQVARQIDSLYEQGYLHLIKSKKYKSSNKFLKLYGLSLKGFIVSLNKQKIDNNYYFKKYISLFPDDLQILVMRFTKLLISEFILYHKSIGLKIDSINLMSKYIREIIYDYDLILNEIDKDKLKKIHNDMIIIDDIRDLITDIKTYDGDEPDEYSFSHSGVDDFEESIIEEILEDDQPHPTKEHIKIEFLINFWPNVIDELGNGTDIEYELENISDDVPPFRLSDYEEEFTDFANQKKSMMMQQWSLRKLNFIKDFSLSY